MPFTRNGRSPAMPLSELEGVHAAYCALAAAIAKSNTLIRDRYPDTHALYLRCEKSYFGNFGIRRSKHAAHKVSCHSSSTSAWTPQRQRAGSQARNTIHW